MGVYLSTPVTTKESDSGGDESTTTLYGVSSMQGWRYSMEDAHVTLPKLKNSSLAMYGVFDGHGGPSVSIWIARHIEEIFQEMLEKYEKQTEEEIRVDEPIPNLALQLLKYAKSLESTFLQLDLLMQKDDSLQELKDIDKQNKEKEKLISSPFPFSQPNTNFFYHDDNGSQYYVQTGENEDDPLEITMVGSRVESPVTAENTLKIENEDSQVSSSINHENVKSESTQDSENPSDGLFQNHSLNNNSTLKESTTSNGQTTMDPAASDDSNSEEEFYDDGDDTHILDENTKAEANDTGNEAKDIPDICGATAIVVLIISTPQPTLIIANAGDSRAILSRGGKAIPLSYDHKPMLPVEFERIEKAGGTVVGGRVDGNLNLSRSIGDLLYKNDPTLEARHQRITSFPDITIVNLHKDDEFLVIACDGIWDCKSNQDVVDFVKTNSTANPTPQELSSICESLCDLCLSPSPEVNEGLGCDNMTCAVIKINNSIFSNTPESESIIYYNHSPSKNNIATQG